MGTKNCLTCRRNDKNSQHMYRRTIRNNGSIDSWKNRSTVQVGSFVTDDFEVESKDVDFNNCSCTCVETAPDEVKKTGSKIKWNDNKSGSSRYHYKCKTVCKQPTKTKRTVVRRNHVLASTSCLNCAGKGSKKFKNECYCCSPPNKPLLPVKPAVTIPNPKRVITSGLRTRDREPSHTSDTLLLAKHLLRDYAPESIFLRKLQKEAKCVYDCQCTSCLIKERTANMKYTKNRQLLEDAYEDIEKASADDFARQTKSCGCQTLTPGNTERNSQPNLTTINNTASNPTTEIDCEKIHCVKQIREEHFFDTHSTANLSSTNNITVPPHKCRHKFTLDSRLVPTPVHADNYGQSLCSYCSKPMEGKKENIFSKSFDKTETDIGKNESEPKSPRQSPRQSAGADTFMRWKENFPSQKTSPRKISFASKNEEIELNIPDELFDDKKKEVKLNYRPTNTWALRYQKGV